MLDFCSEKGITYRDGIETAFERMLKSDVKYRFVIDMASLRR